MDDAVVTAHPPRRRQERSGVWPFLAIFLAFAFVAVFAPWIAPYDPNAQNLLGRLKPPGTEARGVL